MLIETCGISTFFAYYASGFQIAPLPTSWKYYDTKRTTDCKSKAPKKNKENYHDGYSQPPPANVPPSEIRV